MKQPRPTSEEKANELKQFAINDFDQAISAIPTKIKVFKAIPQLEELWISMGEGRSANSDSNFPIYVYFVLGPEDLLGKAVHLFCEEAIDRGLFTEDVIESLYPAGAMLRGNGLFGYAAIHFDPEPSQRCRIVSKTEEVIQPKTTTTIIC